MSVWPNKEDFYLEVDINDDTFDGVEEREARADRYKKYNRQKVFATIWIVFIFWMAFIVMPTFFIDLFTGDLSLIEFGIGALVLITAKAWIALAEFWIVRPGNNMALVKTISRKRKMRNMINEEDFT